MKSGSQLCCGFISLLTGVELICLVDLVAKICVLGVVSSVETLDFAGVAISPFFQMLCGAWQLVGIGLLVGAGVGAVYRIETHLRLYQMYWQASAVVYAVFAMVIAWSGSLCGSVVSAEAMRHGTAIVCGFVDAFMLTWGVIALGACIYFSVVVGAAADEIVDEIPTGLLDRFRKAEEAKERHATLPDYGTAVPAAQPVPFMQPMMGQMSAPMPPMQPVDRAAQVEQLVARVFGELGKLEAKQPVTMPPPMPAPVFSGSMPSMASMPAVPQVLNQPPLSPRSAGQQPNPFSMNQ